MKEPSSQVWRTRFSEKEMIKFTTRYENGYDILTDTRYNEWLATYHLTEVSGYAGITSAHKPRGECNSDLMHSHDIHVLVSLMSGSIR